MDVKRWEPMPEHLTADVIEGAGGIVERDTPEGPVIAIIYRERYGPEWALPKGKRKIGEILAEDSTARGKGGDRFRPNHYQRCWRDCLLGRWCAEDRFLLANAGRPRGAVHSQ